MYQGTEIERCIENVKFSCGVGANKAHGMIQGNLSTDVHIRFFSEIEL